MICTLHRGYAYVVQRSKLRTSNLLNFTAPCNFQLEYITFTFFIFSIKIGHGISS